MITVIVVHTDITDCPLDRPGRDEMMTAICVYTDITDCPLDRPGRD